MIIELVLVLNGILSTLRMAFTKCISTMRTIFLLASLGEAAAYCLFLVLAKKIQILGDRKHRSRLWFYHGCFPLCQRFRKFLSEIKWKGPFRFLLTGIFGITSGGGPLISVGIFRPKFAVPFLTNRFFALIREFGKGIKNHGKSHSYWLFRFNRKMSFHFPSVFPLISDRSVWH